MTKTGKIVLLVFGGLAVVAALMFAGIMVDRVLFRSTFAFPFSHWGMMGGYSNSRSSSYGPGMMYQNDGYTYGPGMMYQDDGYTYGPGMMWQEGYGDDEGCPYMDEGGTYGGGMMRNGGTNGCGAYQGSGGMYGPGMMGGYWQSDEDLPVLTIEQAEEAVTAYLGGAENLEIDEVMIFSNHAYVEVFETDSGMGAMELLVDPVTLAVYPEHGPNMMWNLKYGMHGSSSYQLGEVNLSVEEAVAAAQAYLDEASPGFTADEDADQFYGYYTLHILSDGEVVGMLSVNSFTGDVFPHTWHGEFIEMTGEH